MSLRSEGPRPCGRACTVLLWRATWPHRSRQRCTRRAPASRFTGLAWSESAMVRPSLLCGTLGDSWSRLCARQELRAVAGDARRDQAARGTCSGAPAHVLPIPAAVFSRRLRTVAVAGLRSRRPMVLARHGAWADGRHWAAVIKRSLGSLSSPPAVDHDQDQAQRDKVNRKLTHLLSKCNKRQ